MISEPARNLLSYLKRNIDTGLETIQEARRSVRSMGPSLSNTERLFLECALSSQAHLRRFESAFGPQDRRGTDRPSR